MKFIFILNYSITEPTNPLSKKELNVLMNKKKLDMPILLTNTFP